MDATEAQQIVLAACFGGRAVVALTRGHGLTIVSGGVEKARVAVCVHGEEREYPNGCPR